MKNYTIQELYELGIISGRCKKYFEKKGFPTSKEILENDDKFDGNWSVHSEKGTPVESCVKKIREFIENQMPIADNQITLAGFLAVEVSAKAPDFTGNYKNVVNVINNYVLHTTSEKPGIEILRNRIKQYSENNPNQNKLIERLNRLVSGYQEELINYEKIKIETVDQFNKIIKHLKWNSRQDRIDYLHILTEENPFLLIYYLLSKHYSDKRDKILLEKRLLLFGDEKLIEFDQLAEQENTTSGNLRIRAFRLAKSIPEIMCKLYDAGIINMKQFASEQDGKFITVSPCDKEMFQVSGLRSNFIDYTIEVLESRWKSINKILNNEKKDSRVIEDGSYFFDTRGLVLEYVVKKLERISNLFYNKSNAGVYLSKDKVKENEILWKIVKELFKDYKPVLSEDTLKINLEFNEILASLGEAILNIFVLKDEQDEHVMGNQSWSANAEDLRKELNKYPMYNHLQNRSLMQIRDRMEKLTEIQSIGEAHKYRLISRLTYGKGTTNSIPYKIFTASNCRERLTLDELYQRMVNGGYKWEKNSIKNQLINNKEYFQITDDGKWGCSDRLKGNEGI